ncbi:uracil-DNA glycosylase family 4 [Paraburkholderia sp. GAS333]|uniref:uracil-DNA glycosylase n=1 Tax=Paraburkholderia sp. GAS333 TaxID=3156279 RepID=UPI003D25DBB6
MALHESVLEEFGLAPLWVRRGMAGQQAGDEAGEGAVAAQVAQADDAGVERAVTQAPGNVRQVQAAGSQPMQQPAQRIQAASDIQASAEHRTVSGRPLPSESEHQVAQPVQHSPAPESQPARESRPEAESTQAQQQVQPAAPRQAVPEPQTIQQQRAASPSQTSSQPAPQSHSPEPEPSSFDAPPDDDFAWFDDLPAHPQSEARAEKPALPAIQTLDWDALSERVANCQLCRLCEKRTNTVFGVGDRGADWMLIGEAPGENEDRQGEPFVGQAGKLLDSMLRSLTLARDTNVYIANVIKCRPPGNRNPEPDEVARCEPYLQRQVSLVKPKLIVALGRFAAQSLLKTTASISSLRGRVHEYEGVPVIVTYHPAYLLRSLPDKAKAWADLCLARDTWRAAGGEASNQSE